MKKILVITPSVPVWVDGNYVLFDRKFYDGMLLYKKEWNGILSCVVHKTDSDLPAFGVIRKERREVPFMLTILKYKEKIKYEHLKNASIVLASGDAFEQLHLSTICKKNKIKCVYVIENIPETRYKIIGFEVANPIIRLRKYFHVWIGERKRVFAFISADGIQANGVAAYNEYNRFRNCILYFDTRVKRDSMINDDELESRLSQLSSNHMLRLAFSGRLIRMKGADHLIRLAGMLKDKKIDFKLTIFGSGDLEVGMINDINALGLSDRVAMLGALDFYNELLPEIKANVDLYVVLHRQSDPSCTYLETLSCGIPIIGYNNKSFAGLLKKADIGWGKGIDDLHGIVDIIEYININREIIKEKSRNCIKFAREHNVQNVFKKRIEHLKQLVY